MYKAIFVFLCVLLSGVTSALAQDGSKTKKSSKNKIQYGVASYYSHKFHGRKTSSGEIFNQNKLTGAHNSLPLGTYVKVTNLRNGKSVIVKINDRLHHKNKRVIDLTRAAAVKLGFIKSGLARVKLEVLGKKPPAR